MKKIFGLLSPLLFILLVFTSCEIEPKQVETCKDGQDGKGILEISKTNSDGLVDTYTIVFTDGSSTTFKVTNGSDGKDGTNGTSPTIEISDDGFWIINGEKTNKKAIGADGKDGTNGKDGIDGINGTNGTSPTIDISDDGFWIINGEKTNKKAIGTDGKNGTNGTNGRNGSSGKDGRGITSVIINDLGHLIINYSDSTSNDLGEIVKVHPHEIIEKEIIDVEATCKNTGVKYIVCKECGELIRTIITEKIDHDYNEVVTEATCTTDGYTTHTCSMCGDTFIDNIVPMTGHTYSENYYVSNTKHWKKILCGCSEEIVKENHTFDENGVCTVCGYDQRLGGAFTFELINDEAEYKISAYNHDLKLETIYLPESYNDKPVTEIGENAFAYNSDVKNLIIPDGYKTISSGAFMQCTNLTSIIIPDTIESLGDSVFLDASCLELVNHVYYVGNWAIKSDKQATTITLREGTIGLAPSAFEGEDDIKQITLPESIKYFGYNALHVTGIKTIVIPNNVTTLSYGLLSNCSSLESITFCKNITLIEDWALSSCESLEHIYFNGTESEWNLIIKNTEWNRYSPEFTVHYLGSDE